MKVKKQNAIARAAILFSLMIFPALAAAQSRPNPPTRGNPMGATGDSVRESRERDMNIRRMELEKERDQKPIFEVSKETTKQVLEDFEQLQSINGAIMRDYSAGLAPDYKHISEAMADINKRAARLNTNLLLPSTDEGSPAQVSHSGKQNRSPLLDLNDLIYGFVTNPIFKNRDTIDIELGRQAKRDLQRIITLSDAISKSADRLNKSTKH